MNSLFNPTSAAATLPDPYSVELADLDVSDPRLLQGDAWVQYFKRLRDEDPVHFLQDSPFGPFWSITRFDDIRFVDSNHQLFSSQPEIVIGSPSQDLDLPMFIAMDPPKHDQQRAAVQPVVAPRNLAEMEGVIRSYAETILDQLPRGEAFNWVEHVSMKMTSYVLATLLDMPVSMHKKLTYWSDLSTNLPEISGGNGSREERLQGLQECYQYFVQHWHDKARRRAAGEQPGFDLISLMQSNEDTKDLVDSREFIGNIILLIVGGNDTTRNTMSGGVLALNQNPGEYAKLKADHSLIPGMVSEMIRWQTPLAHMRRIATEDVELGGKTIHKGDKVVMWYVSGNRDERAIEQPDRFWIDRPKPRNHISFGFGIHRCMGNRLAEMQLRIVWEEILKRFRHVEVVGQPRYVQSNFIKGFEQLPVVVR